MSGVNLSFFEDILNLLPVLCIRSVFDAVSKNQKILEAY